MTRDQPVDLLASLYSENVVRICAPMVRKSKLPLRRLVRKYSCDVAFTPMIIAESFLASKTARDCAFSTDSDDHPLVIQFAAKTAFELAESAEIVSPFADGIDLNCGCPQPWALREGYGCYLISQPDLVRDIIRQTQNRVTIPVSIKIRVHDDLKETVRLVQNAEQAGCSWITVHGRTVTQRNEPPNYDAIRLVRESVGIPVVANGDIRSLSDVENVVSRTGVNGVMVARGILQNPAMFAGFSVTPKECISNWISMCLSARVPFFYCHQQLMSMMEKLHSRKQKREFNTLTNLKQVIDYLESHNEI
ncbi:tRNA-dihydrouridine(20a/20b) synthase [NAD(P)+]-like [Oscarella lobularis]|uniref:tRNA-dihydrouridine(20a/20b) synthase [NAD(P)+]-like n=1 Tax=Oscarella lobularis TaxID=121494 RepID=UPI0033144E33